MSCDTVDESGHTKPENDLPDVSAGASITVPVLVRPTQPKPPVHSSWSKRTGFFAVGFASILYLLSALSILYGMAELIGPVLAKSGVLWETLPCIGALNLYEIALLAVLLAIVLFRKASADAVSLSVLVVLFLVATGMALDTVANDHPPTAAVVAAICFILALVKLILLRKHVVPELAGGLYYGVCVLAFWNFMTAPAMAGLIRQGYTDPMILRSAWQTGWLVMLTAVLLMFGRALHVTTGSAVPRESTLPFLRTVGMGWIVGGLLLAGGIVHQYALAWVFDVNWVLGDYLPFAVVVTLLVLELLRSYGICKAETDVAVASIPAVLILVVFGVGAVSVDPWLGVGVFWRIPVLLAMMAVAAGALGLRERRRWLLFVALAYGLVFILVLGATPRQPQSLNWEIFGAALLLTLLVLGVVLRDPRLLGAAVLVVACGMLSSGMIDTLPAAYQPAPWEGAGLVVGFGFLLIALAFPRNVPAAFAAFAACVLSLCMWTAFEDLPGVVVPLTGGTLLAGMGVLTWFRLRNPLASMVLFAPLGRTLYLNASVITGWHYVVLSFLLLAVGAAFSLYRGRTTGD